MDWFLKKAHECQSFPNKPANEGDVAMVEEALCWLGRNPFTERMAIEHVMVFGETGCGKTSGSFAWFLTHYLAHGFGAVINCVTESDIAKFRFYVECSGRSNSMIVIEPSADPSQKPRWRCNLVRYLLEKPGGGLGSRIDQVAELFTVIVEAADRRERAKGGTAGEVFFVNSCKELFRNAAQIGVTARVPMSFRVIDDIISSVPRSAQEVHDPGWQKDSYCYQLINAVEVEKLPRRERLDFERAAIYFLRKFPSEPPDTAGSILATYFASADFLLRGHMADLFDDDTNFVPDMVFEGAIICTNLPPRVYGEAGAILQTAFNYVFQRAAQQRDMENNPRPCVWAADESHAVISETTSQFLADARNRKVACLLATQNISNYMAAVGGQAGKDQMESLLGNAGTKVFHTNGHHPTNEWASKMISQKVNLRMSYHGNMEKAGGGGGGGSEHLEPKVLEALFTELKKGGPANAFLTEAVVFRTGEAFGESQDTWQVVKFKQLIPTTGRK